MITASIPMASMVSTVSRSDSPFFRDEDPAAKESAVQATEASRYSV